MKKPIKSSFQNLSISYELALAIGNSLNLSEMLHEFTHKMVHKTNAHHGIIWVKNGEKKLQPVASAGINIEDVPAQNEIMDLRSVLNQIQKSRQFVLRYKDDKDFLQYCPVLTGKEESVLIVPITNIAILYLIYAGREIADEPLANLLAGLSKKLSVAINACIANKNIIDEVQVRVKAEKELKKKTEQLISGEKELQRLYGESEQARKSLLSILEDVTQKEEALKLSNENFLQVVSNITTVVWKADIGKNGAFENTYSSPVLDELLELPAGTMKNDWDKYFGYIKPEYLEHVNNAFKEAIISPGKQIDCEYEVLKNNGQTAWFHSKGKCFEKNEKLHVFGSTVNITERKQAEKELTKHREHLEKLVKERTKELEEKNKELERFNNLFVNREFRIKELRDKVKELEKKNK
ncbi:MAG: PAS domain-containing protein [Bacteroidales bacterium]|nr:PAS domain-containing protein [Bacteroidales bacterium]